MKRDGNIVRYTAEELRGRKTLTDWDRLRNMTEEELQASIASDPDWKDEPRDWVKDAKPGLPFPLPRENKRQVTLRLDPEVLEHFKRGGRGWQSRINAVLRTFVEADARQQAG